MDQAAAFQQRMQRLNRLAAIAGLPLRAPGSPRSSVALLGSWIPPARQRMHVRVLRAAVRRTVVLLLRAEEWLSARPPVR